MTTTTTQKHLDRIAGEVARYSVTQPDPAKAVRYAYDLAGRHGIEGLRIDLTRRGSDGRTRITITTPDYTTATATAGPEEVTR